MMTMTTRERKTQMLRTPTEGLLAAATPLPCRATFRSHSVALRRVGHLMVRARHCPQGGI